ncbi:hypothetical protein STRIP9103_07408 [Streptomyces ipomoeae 91-03]|uniref:Uncharacterized protein n=1 Tax=Streptomyces ipomoeae 91-03 TaxID=698759 RepID=L1KI43_9ACTN|nr:hypothetical protein STRIP9103_07408 [Streptomyces ipomoeae 91-03]
MRMVGRSHGSCVWGLLGSQVGFGGAWGGAGVVATADQIR